MNDYEENPTKGMTIAIGVIVLAGAWLLLSPKKAKAKTKCPITATKINAWGVDIGKAVFDVKTTQPPSYTTLIKDFPIVGTLPVEQIVVITPDGKFWVYDGGDKKPELSEGTRKSYCDYKIGA